MAHSPIRTPTSSPRRHPARRICTRVTRKMDAWGPRSPDSDLPASTHRVALITGASSGIGEAIARDLGARGFHLALAARRKEALESVAAQIRTSGGGAIP